MTTIFIPCPNCKRSVPLPEGEKAVKCPSCGAKVAAEDRKATK